MNESSLMFPNQIVGIPTDHILRISSEVILAIIDSGLLIDSSRGACFATFQDLTSIFPATLTTAFGYAFPSEEFAANCRSLSIEKIVRTLEHKDHFCSRQSRNEAKGYWAGGFVLRSSRVAGSVSGFKEIEDEAAIITCLCRTGALSSISLGYLQKQILHLDEGENVVQKIDEFLEITRHIK